MFPKSTNTLLNITDVHGDEEDSFVEGGSLFSSASFFSDTFLSLSRQVPQVTTVFKDFCQYAAFMSSRSSSSNCHVFVVHMFEMGWDLVRFFRAYLCEACLNE